MRVLVLFGTTEGQTRKISSFAVDHMSARGHTVVLTDACDVPPTLDIASRKGAPTDVMRDRELTDWDDLARFVDEFLAGAAMRPP